MSEPSGNGVVVAETQVNTTMIDMPSDRGDSVPVNPTSQTPVPAEANHTDRTVSYVKEL